MRYRSQVLPAVSIQIPRWRQNRSNRYRRRWSR